MRLLRRPADRPTRLVPREVADIAWFLVLLFAGSSVFYVVGPLIGSLSSVTRANVPAAALMFVCPRPGTQHPGSSVSACSRSS